METQKDQVQGEDPEEHLNTNLSHRLFLTTILIKTK